MTSKRIQTWAKQILIGLVIVSVGSALRIWPLAMLGGRTAWLTLYPSVMFASLYGGIIGGTAATLFSILSVCCILPRITGITYVKDTPDVVAAGIFTATCVLVAIIFDQKRKADERRREALEERDRFFTMTLDMLCISNKDGYFKRLNPTFSDTLGWSMEELLRTPFIDLVHPDDREATLAEVSRQMQRKEKVINFENRYRHKDGSWRWLSWKSVPQSDGSMYASARDITELKEARVSLAEALEQAARERTRLRFIFDVSPMGISFMYVDHEGTRSLIINDAYLRISGIDRTEAYAEDIAKRITHPDDWPRQEALNKELEAGRIQHYSIDKRYVHKDGSIVWALLYRRSWKYEDGTTETLHLGLDITERKHAEEALRRSEEKLNITLNSIGDGVMATDLEGRITRLNPIAEVLTGWSDAEARGKLVGEVFHIVNEETGAPVPNPVDQVLSTGMNHELANHTVLISRQGKHCPIADSAAPIRDGQGAIIGVVLVFRDATIERTTKERLTGANKALEQTVEARTTEIHQALATLDAMADAAFIIDPKTFVLTYVNRAACRQSGCDRNELIGHGLTAIDSSLTEEECQRMLKPLVMGELSALVVSRKIQRKDATELAVELSVQYISSQEGLHWLIAISRDVSERQKTERLALRSQRLEALGTLAGGVAHDLNNALSPILMGGGMLREKYPDDCEMIDAILASAKRGADMVHQLITFAKGSEGKLTKVVPSVLLEEMLHIAGAVFPKNIHITTLCPPDLPPLMADPTQLHQVLLNLCVNARDAMPNGGVLTIGARHLQLGEKEAASIPDAKPGAYIEFMVKDTGTGIPPQILDRIFDPFFTSKAPDKGTGLGLSTVIGIAKGHGGFVHVWSRPGEGSQFYVGIPISEILPLAENGNDSGQPYQGRGQLVLFVDDELPIREMAELLMRRMNLRPLFATDGAEGLIRMAEHRQDLSAIVTDLHMPHLDGISFVKTIRRMRPDIPIALVSGRLDDSDRNKCQEQNIHSFLEKPFTEAQFTDLMRKLLS